MILLIYINYIPLAKHSYLLLNSYLFWGFFLAVVLLLLNRLLNRTSLNKEKISSYECGFEPFENARIKFNIHYYIIAILFIIFDAEIIFLFPWTLSFSLISLFSYCLVFFFLGLLTLGFIIEWLQSALKW